MYSPNQQDFNFNGMDSGIYDSEAVEQNKKIDEAYEQNNSVQRQKKAADEHVIAIDTALQFRGLSDVKEGLDLLSAGLTQEFQDSNYNPNFKDEESIEDETAKEQHIEVED